MQTPQQRLVEYADDHDEDASLTRLGSTWIASVGASSAKHQHASIAVDRAIRRHRSARYSAAVGPVEPAAYAVDFQVHDVVVVGGEA